MLHLGIHSQGAQYFAVAMLLMFIVGFAMSAGPVIWVLCSEIQPLKGVILVSPAQQQPTG
jgi:SP family galactose:H+ symporter-like MFS transporter